MDPRIRIFLRDDKVFVVNITDKEISIKLLMDGDRIYNIVHLKPAAEVQLLAVEVSTPP